jgi:hypothetical protein
VTLLTPWALLWLAAVAGILGLYLLKPRSRRVEVSSTWLWQGALRQENARSLMQWLRRHLLLLLQLLVALLGVVALARPAFGREVPVGRTAVLVIDASAAMLANDGDPAVVAAARGPSVPQTVSRLDEARARALLLLGQLGPGDRVVVIRAADRAEVVAQGTLPGALDDVRTAIQRLSAAPTEIDMAEALEVTGSVTRSARLGDVVIITGGVMEVDQTTMSHRPSVAIQILQVGKGSADNQAITTLAARRDGAGDIEVFARLRNFSDREASGSLRVLADGELLEEQPVTLPPRQGQELIFKEFPAKATIIQAQLVGRDLLALDNVATTAVVSPPVRKVLLVGGRSDQLERALRAVPGVELTKTDPQRYDPKGGFDIYVFEGWFPNVSPPGHWVLIDPPSRSVAVNVIGTLGRRTDAGRESNDAQIARVLPSPILRGVDLAGVGVTEAKKLALPDWAEEVVSARQAPLIFMGYPRPYRAIVFAFDLRSSNLFGRVGFPVLIANSINWLTGEMSPSAGAWGSDGVASFTPGDALLVQPLPRATRIQVDTPTKKQYKFDGNQPVRFVDTLLPGAYTVTQFAGRDEIGKRVYVSGVIQPGRETMIPDLKPRELVHNLVTVGGPQPQTLVAGPGQERTHSEWWRALGLLALAGLVAEWWWFHR